jgi:hypothetical protein
VVTFDALLGTIARYVERMLGASQDGWRRIKGPSSLMDCSGPTDVLVQQASRLHGAPATLVACPKSHCRFLSEVLFLAPGSTQDSLVSFKAL